MTTLETEWLQSKGGQETGSQKIGQQFLGMQALPSIVKKENEKGSRGNAIN